MTVARHTAVLGLSRPQADLADVLDRALGAGVVAAGDLTLSLADVDLVYVSLRALVASVATLEADGMRFEDSRSPGGAGSDSTSAAPPVRRGSPATAPRRAPTAAVAQPRVGPGASGRERHGGTQPDAQTRLDRGLAQLVLTVVELLRKLMEKQALRRVEAGTLSADQVDRLGAAFDRLERQVAELRRIYGVTEDDLKLTLHGLPGTEDF